MDKILHISLSYAIVLTVNLLTHNIFIAIGIGALLSGAKEIYDYKRIRQDWKERSKDLLADLVGIILAIIIIKI